ncbi:MAG: hypothetical protein ACRD1H_16545 [Vicinamibacterales bacterium]
MTSIMEDDYAPATHNPWLSILSPFVVIALIVLIVWWRRQGD